MLGQAAFGHMVSFLTFDFMSQGTQARLCINLGIAGVGGRWLAREIERRFKRERTYVHLWLIHVDV